MSSLSSLRDEMARNRPYAASAYTSEHRLQRRYGDEDSRASYSSPHSSLQKPSGDGHVEYRRRGSLPAKSPGFAPHVHQNAHILHMPSHDRLASRSFNEQSEDAEGTESTASTTAASTVWDELDDIKSRIRSLETRGKLPSSSNAAITNFGERPATAGTTVTTSSSSPKHQQLHDTPPETSATSDSDAQDVQPLLHTALLKSKGVLSHSEYLTLNAAATEALSLITLTGNRRSYGGLSDGNDRSIRRKANSVCRHLTELCIVLAEHRSEHTPNPARPLTDNDGSKSLPQKQTSSPRSHLPSLEHRHAITDDDDPELRSSSRVMSRLEARRTSLQASNSIMRNNRDQKSGFSSPLQTTTTSSAVDRPGLRRNSSVIRRVDSGPEENGHFRRPLSRATTEIGQVRPSPPTRTSREYLSSQETLNHAQRSPSVQSSLPQRKSYFPNMASSPLTPMSIQPGSRRYPKNSTPPSSADSARLAESRQRRLASLGQPNSASLPRMTTGFANGRARSGEAAG